MKLLFSSCLKVFGNLNREILKDGQKRIYLKSLTSIQGLFRKLRKTIVVIHSTVFCHF